jgi:hypothetical protein
VHDHAFSDLDFQAGRIHAGFFQHAGDQLRQVLLT